MQDFAGLGCTFGDQRGSRDKKIQISEFGLCWSLLVSVYKELLTSANQDSFNR